MSSAVMFGAKVHALASFPIIQQVMGTAAILAGLIITIVAIAKRIFHGIQKKNLEKDLQEIKIKIDEDNDQILAGLFYFILGLATATPVVGSILNGIVWHKNLQIEKPFYS